MTKFLNIKNTLNLIGKNEKKIKIAKQKYKQKWKHIFGFFQQFFLFKPNKKNNPYKKPFSPNSFCLRTNHSHRCSHFSLWMEGKKVFRANSNHYSVLTKTDLRKLCFLAQIHRNLGEKNNKI